MAETPKTNIQKVSLNGKEFEFEVKLDNRSNEKGAFLAINPKTADLGLVNTFVAAAGQAPLVMAIIRAVNKIIGPPSKEAFTEIKEGDKVVWQFDASKASKAILEAVADSVAAAKDELENALAEARAVFEKFFDAEVVVFISKGQCPPPPTVMKMATLRGKIAELEKKLASRTRTKKADKPAPAAKPAA